MIRTLTAAEAATLAGATTAAVRKLCRTGAVAAAKVRGRWQIETASLLHALVRPAKLPTDRPRKGENAPQRVGRAARTTVGHHMSVARRYAVLDAVSDRLNGTTVTALSYLRDVVGAGRAFINRYAAAFGAKVSEAYEAATGHKPAKDGLDYGRGHRYWDCFAYRADELWALEAGARAHKRTAALLAV